MNTFPRRLSPGTHLVRDSEGRWLVHPITSEVPPRYVPLGSVNRGRLSIADYLYRMAEAGYPALYRCADGMVRDRDHVSAKEADAILWGPEAETRIFLWE